MKKAATKYLKPGELRLLVVGDGKTVLPKLKELADNKDLAGKIVMLDADGNPVPPSSLPPAPRCKPRARPSPLPLPRQTAGEGDQSAAFHLSRLRERSAGLPAG